MTPTLRPGDFLWVAKSRLLQRGDIVLIRKNDLLIKRLIGLPGETIALRASRVYVNASRINEPYVLPDAYLEPSADQTLHLDDSAFFVLGDARDDSLDSRRMGVVRREEIKGVACRRIWPLRRWGRLALVLTACAAVRTAHALAAPDRLIAFASETRLVLMIGKYETGQGWVPATNFYAPPEPGTAFTIYGPPGRVGEVTTTDSQRAYRGGVFAGWSAKVSHWDNRAVPYALAVSGQADLAAAALEPIPLDNIEYRGIVARYLRDHSLKVDAPYLTQAYNLPIEGHGRDAAILVAHSDASAMTPEKAADIYAVALLWWNDHGKEKIFPLASQTSHKPAGQSIEEHEKYHGKRDFLRVLCAVDIDGDGWEEIALYRAKEDSTRLVLYHFDGRRLRKVLSADKFAYN